MSRLFITLAALSGFFAVAFGAFGAHALKNKFDEYSLGVYNTAVEYQFYHSLALLGVGLLALWVPHSGILKVSGFAFLAGILIFSGSLYILSFTGMKWLGAITPLGGLAFLVGWACIAWAALQLPNPS